MGKRRNKSTGPRLPHLSEPACKVRPDPKMNIFCPYCDWRNSDSFTGRRRLGNHIVNDHPEDVLFKQGEEPPDFEE